jgi:hypothetical protein
LKESKSAKPAAAGTTTLASSSTSTSTSVPTSKGGLFAFRGAMHASEMPELKPQLTKPEPSPSTPATTTTTTESTPSTTSVPSTSSTTTTGSATTTTPTPTEATLPTPSAAPLPVADNAVSGGRVGGAWWWTLPCTHIDRGETAGFAAVRLLRALYGWTIDSGSIAAIEHNGRTDIGCDGIRITVTARADNLGVDGSYTRAPSAPAPDYRWATLEQLQTAAKEGSIRNDLLASLTPMFAAGDNTGVPLLQVGA